MFWESTHPPPPPTPPPSSYIFGILTHFLQTNGFLFDILTLHSRQHLKDEWYIVLFIPHWKISLIIQFKKEIQQMQFLVKRLVPLSSKFKISNTSVYQRKSFQVWKNRVFFKLDLWAQLGITLIKMKCVPSCGLFRIN